jgi:hypothetical protein
LVLCGAATRLIPSGVRDAQRIAATVIVSLELPGAGAACAGTPLYAATLCGNPLGEPVLAIAGPEIGKRYVKQSGKRHAKTSARTRRA